MKSLTDATARIIVKNPRFIDLTEARGRLRWGLAAMTIIVFFGFVLMIAFAKASLATQVGDGIAPLGIYLYMASLLYVVAVTAFYVHRAGRLFGRMNDELVREIDL